MEAMSYIEYQKMLGLDVSKNEAVPHYDFNFGDGDGNDDAFEVFGTLYLRDGKPLLVHGQIWRLGNHNFLAELTRRFTEAGYPCSPEDVADEEDYGNGHFGLAFKQPPTI